MPIAKSSHIHAAHVMTCPPWSVFLSFTAVMLQGLCFKTGLMSSLFAYRQVLPHPCSSCDDMSTLVRVLELHGGDASRFMFQDGSDEWIVCLSSSLAMSIISQTLDLSSVEMFALTCPSPGPKVRALILRLVPRPRAQGLR